MSSKTKTTQQTLEHTSDQKTEACEEDPTEFRDKRMENAHYWAAQARGWMKNGPNAGIEGTYYVEIIGGRPSIVLDESWNESKAKAVVDGLREHNFPEPLQIRDMEINDNMRIYIREPNDDRLLSNFNNHWRNFTSGSFETEN